MKELNIVVIVITILGSAMLGLSKNISAYTSTCWKRLIIDADGGPDDAMAILLVLSAFRRGDSDFRIIGITCTYGNTEETNVQDNIIETLKIANEFNIPVYAGAKKPLFNTYIPRKWFGPDGFGGFLNHDRPRVVETNNAAMKLIEEARRFPGQLNILALGPLTNIAQAILSDSNFINKINTIYIMGGSVSGTSADYNFGLDPESVFIVLNSRSKPKKLFTRDANALSEIPLKWRKETLGVISSTFMNFLNRAESAGLANIVTSNEKLLIEHGEKAKLWPWGPSDVKIAAAMIWPELIQEEKQYHALPVMNGVGKGLLCVDKNNISDEKENVEIIHKFNAEEFKRKLLRYLA